MRKLIVESHQLCSMYESGMTCAELALRFGVHSSTIHRNLLSLGIFTRRIGPRTGIHAASANPNWNGGRRLGTNGYIWIRLGGKQVLEHRHIIEQTIGRALLPIEVVHHKNGITTDNRIENLELVDSHSLHMSKHAPWNKHNQYCKRGHPLAEARINKNGARDCRVCQKLRRAEKRKALVPLEEKP